ncbi:divalent metal cation transporter MntH [mine drainage metagenome]|uniref:Divalent metal cation transporter MntH n=1 Tax=mine drainage metagenome TaxID=410659 RepID=A0A1J5NY66_9ZZZZ
MAAAVFHTAGQTQVAEIQDAYKLLGGAVGSALAPILFGVALLCSGINSTVTATLAGQIVMEGFVQMRVAPWVRRLVTRSIAIVPALVVTLLYGEKGTAELLVLSQVVLSLQLPFAIVPLVRMTADAKRMNGLPAPRWLTLACWVIGIIIIVLNAKLIWDVAMGN